MASWIQIHDQVTKSGPYDVLREKLINQISKYTKRNVMVYYSGWLQKPQVSSPLFAISDNDKNGFITCLHNAKKEKGLDLILHTPGGNVGATESLIDYLYSLFNGNIRAIVPQISMSGGTLIALSCKEIIMGNQSSLGPVDPQFGTMAAQSYLNEFELACAETMKNPVRAIFWKEILSKIAPGFLQTCIQAIEWSNEILENSLNKVMLKDLDEDSKKATVNTIKKLFCNQDITKAHNRHINKEIAKKAGVVITDLENDPVLEELVLSLHHLLCQTFDTMPCLKIISSGGSDKSLISMDYKAVGIKH